MRCRASMKRSFLKEIMMRDRSKWGMDMAIPVMEQLMKKVKTMMNLKQTLDLVMARILRMR